MVFFVCFPLKTDCWRGVTVVEFSNKNRDIIINYLKKMQFDLLVIGGGITGAGIALDATTRGMKVALVDMQDFAAGTSSRSTKLVHGGLRYLKQFQIKQVAEVGRERAIVYENGPHVTIPEWMLLPIYRGGSLGKFTTSIGLSIYDLLAGVNTHERKTMLDVKQTLEKAPLLRKDGLIGGGLYVEYRTDDARLTIEVIKAAIEKGAIALNYSKVENLIYDNGKIIGAEVVDQTTKEIYQINAKTVVNATGPWVDTIRVKDDSKRGKVLQLTKGVHIVIDQSKFPLKQAVYFDTRDGRMVFAIPREGKVYVGTTDTFYNENPMNPQMTESECEYLLNAISYTFPEVNITKEDVESNWAGLRPLIWEEGKNPSEISRKDEIWESESGLITIAGGKLTGYRKMAEKIVDRVAAKLETEYGLQFSPCVTKQTPISGGNVGGSAKFDEFIVNTIKRGQEVGLSVKEAEELARLYGSNVDHLYRIVEKGLATAKQYELPISLFSKLQYALDAEMVVTPIDFFLRRTSALLFHIQLVKSYKQNVSQYMADYFNWDEDTTKMYEKELDETLNLMEFLK